MNLQPELSSEQALKAATELPDWVEACRWVRGSTQVVGMRDLVDTKSLHNIYNIMINHPDLHRSLAYDEFADCLIWVQPPPWDNKVGWKPRESNDGDAFKIKLWFASLPVNTGPTFNISSQLAEELLYDSARTQTVNPPRDWLENLIWDGVPRLNNWLIDCCGVEATPYTQFVGRKWMVGAVARIFQPGIKFETCLVFEGEQNLGKSLAFRMLATFGNNCYFSDEPIDFRGGKDEFMKLQGKIIIEMSELSSWSKHGNEEIKAFIAKQTDRYRPPYGRRMVERHRRFVLAGSTNQMGNWLTDETGNRRYWPVLCKDINLKAIEESKAQLWAEAVALYHRKEQLWLNQDEYGQAKLEQAERLAISSLRGDILHAIRRIQEEDYRSEEMCGGFTLRELMIKMDVPIPQRTNKGMAGVIIKDIQMMGYKELRRQVNGEKIRLWAKYDNKSLTIP